MDAYGLILGLASGGPFLCFRFSLPLYYFTPILITIFNFLETKKQIVYSKEKPHQTILKTKVLNPIGRFQKRKHFGNVETLTKI